jgi:hypothetical protein
MINARNVRIKAPFENGDSTSEQVPWERSRGTWRWKIPPEWTFHRLSADELQ